MRLSEEETDKLLILCTAISSVPKEEIHKIIDSYAVVKGEDEGAIKYIHGNLINVVMEDVVAISEDKDKVEDIPLAANYFK